MLPHVSCCKHIAKQHLPPPFRRPACYRIVHAVFPHVIPRAFLCVAQATSYDHPIAAILLVKRCIANAVVKHVTVGTATTVKGLSDQCDTGRSICLLEGARARDLGFDVCTPDRVPSPPLYLFEKELAAFSRDGVYMTTQVLGAVSSALHARVVLWVQHATAPTKLVVHRLHAQHGGALSVHSPFGATGVIHLYFYNSYNPCDSDVHLWGSGRVGHFEVLLLQRPACGMARLDAESAIKSNNYALER